MSIYRDQVRAAIYVRISQDSEDTGLGVDRQRRDCEALAVAKGWSVAEVFTDNDVSASSGRPRPAYIRMVQAIDDGRVQGIVCWDVDRLTRTPRELEDVIDWADRHGLHLASVGGDIDLSTPQGRMTARIKGSVARHEVEQSSRRIRRKRQQLAEQGRYVGPRPFGWDWTVNDDGTKGQGLVINEPEAAVVRESVERTIGGESLRSIVRSFNSRGLTTARGNTWQAANFRAMLLRWTNAGVLIHRGEEMGTGDWPAIISREEQEQVVAILTDPKRRTNNRGTAEKYLLSGLIRCAECHGPLHGAGEHTYPAPYRLADGTVRAYNRTHPPRYRCQTPGCRKVTQRMEALDSWVTEYVTSLLTHQGVKLLGGDPASAEAARENRDALKAKLNIAADKWAADEITAEQFARITAQLRLRLEDAQATLSEAMPAEGLAEFTGATAPTTWAAATLEERRAVIRALVGAGLWIIVGRVGQRRGKKSGPAPFNPESVTISWEKGSAHAS